MNRKPTHKPENIDATDDPTALRPAKAAEMLDCSAGLVRKLMREGKLAYCYAGSDKRVRLSAIRAYIEHNTVQRDDAA